MSATKVLYGFRIREALDMAEPNPRPTIDIGEETDWQVVDPPPSDDIPDGHAHPVVAQTEVTYRPEHVDANDAIKLAAMTMKRQYDGRHKPQFFQVGDFVSLRLHRGYNVPGLKDRNVKIEQQFAGPFRVLERIGRLAYRIDLPPSMSRIHPVISIAHLEPATDPETDPYHRERHPAVNLDATKTVDRILRRRSITRRNGISTYQYLVRWTGLGVEYDEWVSFMDIPIAMRLAFDQTMDTNAQLEDFARRALGHE